VYQKRQLLVHAFGIMLKMGLYSVIRWQCHWRHWQQRICTFHRTWNCRCDLRIYRSIETKDLKKISVFFFGSRWINCSRNVLLTLDGLRGAVLQMIAHGFVVVGLFYAAEIIFRRYETRAIAEMAVFVRNHQNSLRCFLILVLASVACQLLLTLLEFTVL
jgi:NADH-quinone oxidoreductase subunit M